MGVSESPKAVRRLRLLSDKSWSHRGPSTTAPGVKQPIPTPKDTCIKLIGRSTVLKGLTIPPSYNV